MLINDKDKRSADICVWWVTSKGKVTVPDSHFVSSQHWLHICIAVRCDWTYSTSKKYRKNNATKTRFHIIEPFRYSFFGCQMLVEHCDELHLWLFFYLWTWGTRIHSLKTQQMDKSHCKNVSEKFFKKRAQSFCRWHMVWYFVTNSIIFILYSQMLFWGHCIWSSLNLSFGV